MWKVSFVGNYSVVSEVNDFALFTSTNLSFIRLSDAPMDKIIKIGILSFHNSCAVLEISNTLDITHITYGNPGKNLKQLYLNVSY